MKLSADSCLQTKGYDPVFGARPVKRAVQRELETGLAKALLKGEFGEDDTGTPQQDLSPSDLTCVYALTWCGEDNACPCCIAEHSTEGAFIGACAVIMGAPGGVSADHLELRARDRRRDRNDFAMLSMSLKWMLWCSDCGGSRGRLSRPLGVQGQESQGGQWRQASAAAGGARVSKACLWASGQNAAGSG